MYRLVTSLTFIVAVAPLPALAQGVERVVVFADRAEVTRAIEARCVSGRLSVELPPLPPALDLRTLRAEVSSGAKLGAVRTRLAPRDPARDERLKALKTERDRLLDQAAELRDEAATARERSEGASAFGTFLGAIMREEIRDPKALPDRWKKSLDLVAAERLSGKQRALEIEAQARKVARELQQIDQRYSIAEAGAQGEARYVTVDADCGNSSAVAVRVSYVIPSATWHPEYDLRFFPQNASKLGPGRVELTVGAIVQQATGEDWTEATIVLSTAQPKLGGEAPYPAPLYIEGYEIEKDKVLVQGTEQRKSLEEGQGAPAAGPTGAALEDGGKAFTLTLPHRTTVRSDGRPYWVPVDEVRASGEAKLVTIPKLQQVVYRVLALKNPARYALPGGRVHAYRGGSYVGDSQLDYSAPGEPIEVSLGIDEELRVERTDKRAVDKSPSFLGNTRRFEREYRIAVRNQSDGPRRIEIRENIPVSKDERIEVELLKGKTTGGHRLDPERGIVHWVLDLPQGREKSVELGYVIGLPKDWKMQ